MCIRDSINTGLSLVFVPIKTRCNGSVIPSDLSWLKKDISTIPFNTAIPNKAINPIPAEMLKGIPRNQSAKTPPIADNGMAVKMSKDCFILLKVKNNSTKIKPNAIGKACLLYTSRCV